MRALLAVLILFVLARHCADGAATKSAAKKRNQVLKKRATAPSGLPPSSQSDPASSSDNSVISLDGDDSESAEDEMTELDILYEGSAKTSEKIACPPCAVRTFVLEHALAQYWRNDVSSAFACVCEILQSNPNDQMARALLVTLRSSRLIHKNTLSDIAGPTKNAKVVLSSWEVLGPMGVGKLELDGDATFTGISFHRQHRGDVGSYILAMAANATVASDLVSNGHISWQPFVVKSSGQVELHFQVDWNDLVQGLANTAVYELQAWARTSTYVKEAGSYLLDCQGVHTAYLRNDNLTRILIADVYRAQQVRATVDLKAGIVGIVLPIRAAIQGAFRCELSPAPTSMIVSPPSDVPHLVEFPSSPNIGYLVSNVFRIVVHNPFHQVVTFEYGLEKPTGGWILQEATGNRDPSIAPRHSPIAPGQTMALSLELIQANHLQDSPFPPSLPCRSRPMRILLTPSKGLPSELALDLTCRKHTQSFHLSFLDHDHSVAQAAVILPLEFHSPEIAPLVRAFRAHPTHGGGGGGSGGAGGQGGATSPKKARGTRSRKSTDPLPRSAEEGSPSSSTPASPTSPATARETEEDWAKNIHEHRGYPLLLTLHGSGIAALNHADAHKVMLPGAKDYTFGVNSYYLLAPTRFGAHNWEGVGYETALTAIRALTHITETYPSLFPKLHSTSHALLSGHSMGGHGAWVLAHRHPDLFSCVLPASGWIKKEEYSTGNAFQGLDQSTSYLDPSIKNLLEASWSEDHIDRLASNLAHSRVHVRVGSHDRTTHPWYSRRMYRVLRQAGSNVTYEEVPSKQHWWWDSLQPNDGGVLNDDVLREFYASCHEEFVQSMLYQRRYYDYLQHRTQQLAEEISSLSTPPESLPSPSPSRRGFVDYLLQKALEGMTEKEQRVARREQVTQWIHRQRCQSSIELSVIHSSVTSTLCGVSILDAHRVFALSTLQASVVARKSREGSERECRITTGNVRRFSLRTQGGDLCMDATRIRVNGQVVIDRTGSNATSASSLSPPVWTFCLSSSSRAAVQVCPSDTSSLSLAHKVSTNMGPLRHIYARPVVIVFGTPADQRMRVAMKDLALYIANAHFAAHHAMVTVLSDLEYRTTAQYKSNVLANHVFIGDVNTNKVLKLLMAQEKQDVSKWTIPLQMRLPSGLDFWGYRTSEEDEEDGEEDGEGERDAGEEAWEGGSPRWTGSARRSAEGESMHPEAKEARGTPRPARPRQGFSLGNASFDKADQAIAFTFPLLRPGHRGLSPATSMAVCLYANSAQGYLHLSRLTWPVIPPMVRSPLATNLPDFTILDSSVWTKGPGGFLAAGFWTMDWEYDPAQGYLAALYQ